MKHYLLTIMLIMVGMGTLCAQSEASKPYKVYAVSNAHFDTQWNWDVQTSIGVGLLRTLEQNIWLIENYPDYIFNFEGGVKYQWIKEYYPLHYAKVVAYIKQGRWYPAGACWDANDPIVPSTESAFRNILLGQMWYKKEFGVKSEDLFLPDSFGFSYAMPTIAAHAGLIGFSTNKLSWRNSIPKYPFLIGLWQGVDGSRIMSVMSGGRYDLDWTELDLSNSQLLLDRIEESGLGIDYHYYGVGDEGGAPSPFSAEAVETGIQGKGPIQIISANSALMYKDYLPFEQHPELPLYDGELLLDTHGSGCYTSHGEMKLLNRRNEQLGNAAEKAAVMADWFEGLPYPGSTLTEAWRRMIWHQFHDDITGTSIPRAYEFSWNDELLSQEQFVDVMQNAGSIVSKLLDTRGRGVPLVIYNPTGYERTGIVEATIPLPGGTRHLTAYGPDGRSSAVQILSQQDSLARIAFMAKVASVSYTVFDIRKQRHPLKHSLKTSGLAVENSTYKLTLNEVGDIGSIIDKRNGKELVKEGKAIRLALFTENPSPAFPSWEILRSVMEKEPVSITSGVSIEIEEEGPVYSSIRVNKRYQNSSVTQWIRLYAGGAEDRIDIVTELDWNARNILLKAEFPLSISNPKATYDIGIGSIDRGNNTDHQYEVYAQQWVNLCEEDNNYGVSIISDCKYGWDKPNDYTLRNTLLHIPSIEESGLWYPYQASQDLGHHRFTYSIIAHSGDVHQGEILRKAEEQNIPLIAYRTPKHIGLIGRSFSFVKSSTPQVAIKMLKKSEDEAFYVIRIYETHGKAVQNAELTFAEEIIEAYELNAIEEVIESAPTRANKLLVNANPYQPKTYGVRLRSSSTQVGAPKSLPLAIPYSHIGITPDGFYTTFYNTDGQFDQSNRSYSAELIGRSILTDGIRFEIGKPGIPNVLHAQGEEIDISGYQEYQKLYILAAATDTNRRATFLVDGRPHTFEIPYYSGYYGQMGWPGFSEAYLREADIAYIGTHRHNLLGGNEPYVFTYIYKFGIDLPAGARRVQLPDDSHIAIFALSLASTYTEELTAATEVRALPHQRVPQNFVELDTPNNLLAGRSITSFSNRRRAPEGHRAPKAVDGLEETLWKDWFDNPTGRPKFMEIDLGQEQILSSWKVVHYGKEEPLLNTRDFKLMVKKEADADWQTVDEVTENTADLTERHLATPLEARYIRLEVTKGSASGNQQVSIREFSAR